MLIKLIPTRELTSKKSRERLRVKKNYGRVSRSSRKGSSRAWLFAVDGVSLSRAGQQFFNDALSRLGERRGFAIARARTIVSLRVNALMGLFKRMHPARVPHSRSPDRASFTCRRCRSRPGTGCRPSRRFDIPGGVFDRTKVNAG